jgi:hypothetical protein
VMLKKGWPPHLPSSFPCEFPNVWVWSVTGWCYSQSLKCRIAYEDASGRQQITTVQFKKAYSQFAQEAIVGHFWDVFTTLDFSVTFGVFRQNHCFHLGWPIRIRRYAIRLYATLYDTVKQDRYGPITAAIRLPFFDVVSSSVLCHKLWG